MRGKFEKASVADARKDSRLTTRKQTCMDQILPMYSCSSSEDCLCSNEDITAIVEVCVSHNCTYADQLGMKLPRNVDSTATDADQ